MLGPSGSAPASAQDGVSLFKVITVRDEIVIGLSLTELDGIGGARDAGAVAGALATRGELTVWQYAVRKAENGSLQQAPLRRVGLLAHGSLRVEPYLSPLPVIAP
ncbi:MAG: hypothetical protein O9315_17930 [Beijerinckiaceae bacterium]|nr:hypothetical protein [Beijerinckiaceae bacterium]